MYLRYDDTQEKNIDIMFPIDVRDATAWNEKKWGIFKSVNTFKGSMKVSHLKSIEYFYIDVDHKENLTETLNNSPLEPSLVIETARGYHAYWRVCNAKLDNYQAVQTVLYTYYGADNLKNVNRVLRVPGFYHWKDVNNPYLIKVIAYNKNIYTEELILNTYPEVDIIPSKTELKMGNIWNNPILNEVSNIPIEKSLMILSGTRGVNGEVFSFRDNFNGTKQILVNNKITGAWIDEQGFIGSYSGGGPTIVQWVKWYQKDWYLVVNICKFILEVYNEHSKHI